jgi:hypothetical protein
MTSRCAFRHAVCMAAACCAWAQTPVAPSNEPTQGQGGDNASNYNIRQSFEAGYRWETTGGDFGMYQSTVNYTNGLRLLASSLDVQSRDGHGGFFDQIVLNTQGLGNDPYQFASLHIEKNRLYRYDLTWRSIAYVNPAATISFGEHAMDTIRHLQDQDLTLFPQSSLRFFLGYSRNTQSGPALTTQQLFDARGDEFPLFTNIRREQNEYRLGGEVRFAGFRLNVMHGWQDFKEDTPTGGTPLPQGNNPNDLTTLNSFQRSAPYHGTSPYWRGALFREGRFGEHRFWTMNALATYVAGQRGFVQDEFANGTSRIGALTQLQVVTLGNAQRPAFTGNFTFSLFPTSWITLTNQSSFYNIRMLGDSVYTQFTNGAQGTAVLPFTYLGIRTVANTTDAEIRVRPWFSVHAGYDFSYRLIRSVEGQTVVGNPLQEVTAEQTNQLHSGVLGFRLKPIASLTIRLDGELGRADHPIYPISEGNFQAFRGRIEWKHRSLRLSGYGRSDYNINSVSLSSFASHARQYGADASWAGNKWFSIDASYAKQHLYTLGGIDYFADRAEVTGESSLYISNIHTATLAARFNFKDKADISVGYSHVQDVGDGRAGPLGTGTLFVSGLVSVGSFQYTSQPALAAAQTFPLRFLSPMARISIRINNKVRWNAGYQYYGYAEDFSALQNYRAHTGYTSLAWSF